MCDTCSEVSEPCELLNLTTEIVASHVANTEVPTAELPVLIEAIYDKLTDLSLKTVDSYAELVPAVDIESSVTSDYIVCLEDGKQFKMLKKHLMTSYGMTPEEYRAKWNLSADYPMVAPNYAAKRQELAKKSGLGRRPK